MHDRARVLSLDGAERTEPLWNGQCHDFHHVQAAVGGAVQRRAQPLQIDAGLLDTRAAANDRSVAGHNGRDVELIDGIKVNHDDDAWVLALPDPEEPITHIWAEAASDGDARRLAQEYARRIRQLVR